MCWRDYNNAIPGSFKSLIVPAADVPQQLEIGMLTLSLWKAGASTFGEQCLWKLSAIHRRCRLFIKSQSYRVLSQRPHVYCVVQIHHVAANHTLLGGGRRSYHWDMCFKLFGTQLPGAVSHGPQSWHNVPNNADYLCKHKAYRYEKKTWVSIPKNFHSMSPLAMFSSWLDFFSQL